MNPLSAALGWVKTKATVIVLGVMVAAIAAAGFIAWYYYEQNAKTQSSLNDTNVKLGNLNTQLEQLQKNFDQLKASTDASRQVQAEVTEKTVVVKQKTSEIQKIVDERVEDIRQKYSELADTVENRTAREADISRERVSGLWETFCIAQPSHARCL